jgi:hypothetical protein
MGYDNGSALGVYNHYGVRTTGGAVGQERLTNTTYIVRIDLTGQSIADAVAGFMPPVYIPKYANFVSAMLQVDEAFVVTGTTPTLLVGAAGSVATDGFIITEAELEAVGLKALANDGEGTWDVAHASGTAAAAKIAMELEGDAAVAATSGKGTLILEYQCVAKA